MTIRCHRIPRHKKCHHPSHVPLRLGPSRKSLRSLAHRYHRWRHYVSTRRVVLVWLLLRVSWSSLIWACASNAIFVWHCIQDWNDPL